MANPRVRRLPISCEPCRIRKIRCPRDGTPCGTCVRRGIPPLHCQYAKRQVRPNPQGGDLPSAPVRDNSAAGGGDLLSPRSTAVSSNTSGGANADLALRVQKLEEQLLAQAEAARSTGVSNPATQYSSPVRNLSLAPGPVLTPNHSSQTLHGTLVNSPTGHVRFVPTSMQSDGSLEEIDQDSHGGITATPSGPFPLGESDRPTMAYFVAQLPPRSHCTEMVNTYFSSFASLFHILHDPTFREQYEAFMEDPESMPLSWMALLFTVIGTAVYAMDTDSPILDDLSRRRDNKGKVTELAERYRSLALRALEADHYLWNHNVTTLQALILLIHSISHSHGQTWTLLGLTYHLAVSIGCHIDPEVFGLAAIECEERRRCWSGLMMLYTSQNMVMGHLGISKTLLPSNSRPPADLDDEDLIPSQQETPPSSDRATQMSYLLLKFRLYEIASEVCSLVTSPARPPDATVRDLDDALTREQTSWEARYRRHIQTAPLPVYQRAHLNILYSYASHVMLLLHHRTALEREAPSASAREFSRRRILNHAKRLFGVHATLYDSPDFAPFAWYNRGLGSFHAQHAAILVLSLLGTEEVQSELENWKTLLRDCLTRFELMQESSTICAKGAPVLKRLIDRALTDPYPSPQSLQTGQPSSLTVEQGHSMQQMQDSNMESQPFDSSYLGASEDVDMGLTMDQLAVQHWLSPVGVPWDMWD